MGAVGGLIDGLRARSGDVGFLDRLDDVRRRMITSAVVYILATVGAFYVVVNYNVLGLFTAPITPYLDGEKIKFLSPLDPFMVSMKLALAIGFLLTLPYLLSQVWGALAPLMRPQEKKLVAPAVIGGAILFVVGVGFGYTTVLPVMLRFTMGFQVESLEQSVVIGEYLKVVLKLLLGFGAAFELPVFILLLTVLGVVTPQFLADKRRHAIAIITVVSALLTPPDLGSMVLLMLPLWFLYEISIVVAKAILANRLRAAREQEA